MRGTCIGGGLQSAGCCLQAGRACGKLLSTAPVWLLHPGLRANCATKQGFIVYIKMQFLATYKRCFCRTQQLASAVVVPLMAACTRALLQCVLRNFWNSSVTKISLGFVT